MAAVLFASLALFVDPQPHSAALNMAWDEALVHTCPRPLLRVYRWERPSLSIGYFDPWSLTAAHPEREAVRRWTGGGLVLHGEDWTYSLIIPRSDPFASVRPSISYRLIHEAVGRALSKARLASASLSAQAAPKVSRACFENAVENDLLIEGRKIAGAAQRRTRHGILHQGSLLGPQPDDGFTLLLAGMLAPRIEEGTNWGDACRKEAEALVISKYNHLKWNHLH